jgi:uncharacterized protein involved in exopolysaccharide biosynthesis
MAPGIEPKQFDLSVFTARFVIPVLERKWKALIIFISVLIISGIPAAMVKPEYVSQTILKIDAPFNRATTRLSNQDAYMATRYAALDVISEARRIQSGAFCANVFSRLPEEAKEDLKTSLDLGSQVIAGILHPLSLFGLNDAGEKRSDIPKESIVMEMIQRLTLNTDDEARLITIQIKTVDKTVAPIILKHMVNAFLEVNAEENKASVRAETQFVERERAKAYLNYLDAENKMIELRKSYGIPAEVEVTRDIGLQLEMRRLEFNLDNAKKRLFTVDQLLTETQMREAGMLGNIKVISPPSAPLEPSRRTGLKIIGTGFAAGLALALGIVFLLEYLEGPLRHELDVEDILRLPVIGVIPRI